MYSFYLFIARLFLFPSFILLLTLLYTPVPLLNCALVLLYNTLYIPFLQYFSIIFYWPILSSLQLQTKPSRVLSNFSFYMTLPFTSYLNCPPHPFPTFSKSSITLPYFINYIIIHKTPISHILIYLHSFFKRPYLPFPVLYTPHFYTYPPTYTRLSTLKHLSSLQLQTFPISTFKTYL